MNLGNPVFRDEELKLLVIIECSSIVADLASLVVNEEVLAGVSPSDNPVAALLLNVP